MSWSEERLEALKRLAAQGFSASQIAGEIGHGVTRNAVIGKALRIGVTINSRATFTRQRENEWSEAERKLLLSCIDQGMSASVTSEAMQRAGFMRSKPACINRAQIEGKPFSAKPVAAPRLGLSLPRGRPKSDPGTPHPPRAICTANDDPPSQGGVGLLGLEFHHCRWPMGDPRAEDFRFCGGTAREGGPYCATHARIAYQPVQARVREARPRDARDNRRLFA